MLLGLQHFSLFSRLAWAIPALADSPKAPPSAYYFRAMRLAPTVH